ncbi:MAG: type II toxin-antitoxin system RelE family toxin [Gemmatimonadaceae bacterium]
MASYSVFIKPSAVKELEKVPLKLRRVIARKILSLAVDPRPHGSQKLSGAELYRIRQGDFRALYDVQDKARIVVVIKIGNRRDVYR